jgi:hypothetical protein
MKQKVTPLLILICFISISACKSAHPSQSFLSKEAFGTASKCDQAIRYYSQKIISRGETINVNMEVVINTAAKVISLKSEDPNGEKDAFNTIIENWDCNLNADLTAGGATYTGYIKQLDGSTTRAVVKVEAKDGALTIQNGEPGLEGQFIIVVSKWEVVTE